MANEIIYSSLHTSLPVSAAVDIYLTRIELQPDPLLRQKNNHRYHLGTCIFFYNLPICSMLENSYYPVSVSIFSSKIFFFQNKKIALIFISLTL